MSRAIPTRRDVLRGASTAAAGVTVAATASASSGRARDSRELLRVGLIGCGGRGTGAAVNALRADDNVKLTALGDVFSDHLEERLTALSEIEDIAGKLDVPEERRFVGWDAYQHVIDHCDVVLLATSPTSSPAPAFPCRPKPVRGSRGCGAATRGPGSW